MRVHQLSFAALAIAAGLSLTACQSDDDGKARSDPSAASSASTGGAGTGGADQGGGASAGQGTGGKSSGGQGATGANGSGGSGSASELGKCRTADLQITAKDRTITGDDGTVVVSLRNRSGHSCAISGYAGVDLKTSAGSLSAKRTGAKSPSVVLKNGESIDFGISYPRNDSGGSGIRVTGLLVTPPNETHTATLHWPGAPSLPITENGGTPVKVGPIGSAGQGG
ncbi:DUF4232 domain-containing protein [Streptomyces sp. cg36]|uniref:DUF4232 domain-containing protein n=1 Tax=Streptomyces sp. cg36 TaxID=3238798 RepID=UPI0034E1C4D3